jgi:hypothetical protein
MRVYLAGPMRGIPHYNFPAFDRAREALRAMGHDVVSPADLDRSAGFDAMTLPDDTDWGDVPPDFDLLEAMERDREAIRGADAICLLPGWQSSEGSQEELSEAKKWGKIVFGFWAGLDHVPAAMTPLDTGPIRQEAMVYET